MGITQRLAEEVASTRYQDIPQDTVDLLKQWVIDHIGISFFSYGFFGKALSQYARAVGGKPEATVIGSGLKVFCGTAAATNAQMAADSNFDETGPGIHALAPILFTAIAVGERVEASGQDVLLAVAAAYDLNSRLYHSIKAPASAWVHPEEGRRHTTLCTAACAAKLLRLPPQQINKAMGLGWVSHVPLSLDYCFGRLGGENRFRIAPAMWSSQCGVQSALIASICDSGPSDILDKDGEIYNVEALTKEIESFSSIKELHFKPYLGSYGCMGGIELVIKLVKGNSLHPDDIERITFTGDRHYVGPTASYKAAVPRDFMQAGASIPWDIANAVLGYEAGPDWVAPEALKDTKRIDMASKVVLLPGDKPDNRIEIMAKGKTYTGEVAWEDFPGSPKRPMTKEQTGSKFLRCVKPVLGEKQAKKLIDVCSHLDSLDNIKQLTELFMRQRS